MSAMSNKKLIDDPEHCILLYLELCKYNILCAMKVQVRILLPAFYAYDFYNFFGKKEIGPTSTL